MKVNSENGLEGPGDDGYSWRKYGQKDILGAKYPRFILSLSLYIKRNQTHIHMHPQSHNNSRIIKWNIFLPLQQNVVGKT